MDNDFGDLENTSGASFTTSPTPTTAAPASNRLSPPGKGPAKAPPKGDRAVRDYVLKGGMISKNC